tara:strand:+ start:2201 stop:3292 length:1092 start_codon:yes stop_codon:yes gene_type:complete
MIRLRGNKVTSTCPFAPWTHSSGRSEHRSFVILQSSRGGWHYRCLSCGEGSWLCAFVHRMKHYQGAMDMKGMVLAYDPYNEDPSPRPPKVHQYRMGGAVVGESDRRETTVGTSVTYDRDRNRLVLDEPAPKVPDWLPKAMARWQSGHMPPYAHKRGIHPDVYHGWGLGYAHKTRRLVFPIYDVAGELIATTARLVIADDKDRCIGCGHTRLKPDSFDAAGNPKRHYACPSCHFRYAKWVHSKGFDRRHTIFGLSRAVVGSDVAIVEGPFDALALHAAGVEFPVALLGSEVSSPQLDVLASVADRVFAVGDGDQAGRKMNARLRDGLGALGVECIEVPLPDGMDPDSMGRDALLEVLTKAGVID